MNGDMNIVFEMRSERAFAEVQLIMSAAVHGATMHVLEKHGRPVNDTEPYSASCKILCDKFERSVREGLGLLEAVNALRVAGWPDLLVTNMGMQTKASGGLQ